MKGDLERVRKLVSTLRQQGKLGPDATPHPLCDRLVMQDGSPAPDVLRLWASLDDHYPWYLSSRRSDQPIADEAGRVVTRPMAEILEELCIDDLAEELNLDDPDDEEAQDTRKHLEGLVKRFVRRFPGEGVIMEPREDPQPILWFAPKGPTLIWYEDESFERKERWGAWLEDLFAGGGEAGDGHTAGVGN